FGWIGERVMRDERGDVAKLRSVGLQKFAARRDAVEKVGDADRGACGKAGGFPANEFASGKFDARAFDVFFCTGFEEQARDGGDCRESFAAEAERGNGEEIIRGAQLAGGVALEGEQRVIVSHAMTIV